VVNFYSNFCVKQLAKVYQLKLCYNYLQERLWPLKNVKCFLQYLLLRIYGKATHDVM